MTVPVSSDHGATAGAGGGALMQGDLWSRRAADWAEQEEHQRPVYDAVLADLGVRDGTRLLEVACGSGVALAAAIELGARVSGIDAATGLIEIARRRAPAADLRVGDFLALPYADGTFDVVTGFNAFQFADDMVAALREAGRVTRPGGLVAIQVWGRPEKTPIGGVVRAFAPHLPFPLPSGPGGRGLAEPGVLEELAVAAGLTPERAGDVVCASDYADDDALVRLASSAGLAVLAAGIAGDEVIRLGILEAMAPFRTAGGGYHTDNEWHYLIARV
jgi:SAM-dependent methyltransferase